MIALRFLELFKPISRVIPEVKPPERKVSFQNRLIWTLLALLIYFIMSEIPLYGIPVTTSGDTFTAYRVIFLLGWLEFWRTDQTGRCDRVSR